MNPERIIFAYNADNGLFNAVNDWAHKFFSPQTYQCSLCRYTFGLSGMLIPWKNFLQTLPFPSEFLHRDEFRTRFPEFASNSLPLILAETDGRGEILVDSSAIKDSGGLAALIGLVQARLNEWSSAHAARIAPPQSASG